MKKLFEGQPIDVVFESHKFLFNVEDVAYAVGYTRTASLEHHIKASKYYVIAKNGKAYVTKEGLKYAASVATRTPYLKRLAAWGNKIKQSDLVTTVEKGLNDIMKIIAKPQPAPVVVETLYGIKEAATKLGMSAKELSDWLVDKGYAGRYSSNNSLFWKDWFRDQKYGTRPVIGEGKDARESNVAKLTQTGFDFVKNRLESERQASVLAFSQKEANEAEKLEAEIDQLILDTFLDKSAPNSSFELVYTIKTPELLNKIKGIIAQVKLKEKKT